MDGEIEIVCVIEVECGRDIDTREKELPEGVLRDQAVIEREKSL